MIAAFALVCSTLNPMECALAIDPNPHLTYESCVDTQEEFTNSVESNGRFFIAQTVCYDLSQ